MPFHSVLPQGVKKLTVPGWLQGSENYCRLPWRLGTADAKVPVKIVVSRKFQVIYENFLRRKLKSTEMF